MKTLRSRLVASYSGMVTLTVAITMIAGFIVVRSQLLAGTDFLLDAEFEEVNPKLANLPAAEAEIERALHEHTAIDAPFYFFQVHDDRGRVLFRSSNLGGKVLPDLTPSHFTRRSVVLGELGPLRVSEYRTGRLHVQIASSLNYLSGLSRRFYRTILLAVPAVLLLSLAIGYCLCEITLRPLRLIEQAARRISVSNLSERIPIAAQDEIGRLSELLNAMFDRLEKSFQQVKQFTADFSHELRTPLSLIALHAEKVLKKGALDPENSAALQEVLVETGRLNHIIDQLLTVAKAEAHVLPLKLAPHSLRQFIEEFAEDAAALAEASGQRFSLVKCDSGSAVFDSSWIRQVLHNLLSNAIKFSPVDGLIELESEFDGQHWRVTLRDEGPGIPPEQAENIFQRFTQLNRAPGAPAGSGLGLAVSKSIVELHQGRIYHEPAAGGGACMVISLPASLEPDGSPRRAA